MVEEPLDGYSLQFQNFEELDTCTLAFEIFRISGGRADVLNVDLSKASTTNALENFQNHLTSNLRFTHEQYVPIQKSTRTNAEQLPLRKALVKCCPDSTDRC